MKVSKHSNDEVTPLVPSDLEGYDQDEPFMGKTVSRGRSSIFDQQSLHELEAAVGEKAVEIVTTTAAGFFVQMVLFFMLCMVIGLTPFFTQLLLYDPVTKKKTATFIPQTPYLVDFAMTVCLSNILSLVFYGTEGLKACWDIKSILRLSPVSLLYGTAQSLEVIAMLFLDSAFRTILNQLKLPLSAVLQRIFLGEKRSTVQWCLVAATTLAVLGFSHHKAVASGGLSLDVGPGLAVGITAVSCSFFASWMTDIKTKKMKSHLICQMAQLRITTVLVVAAYTVGYAYYYNLLDKLLFAGWNIYVFGLSCFLVLKDLLTIYILKRLSNIWLGLATCAGLGVSWLFDILFLDQKFDTTLFVFIAMVSVLVIAYPASKDKK